ncbi:MAG: translation initiation factor Sui1 [Planctomycetes bacterium]|nr:translation initiation factor Sui1 [Planctomycetota bacterium]
MLAAAVAAGRSVRRDEHLEAGGRGDVLRDGRRRDEQRGEQRGGEERAFGHRDLLSTERASPPARQPARDNGRTLLHHGHSRPTGAPRVKGRRPIDRGELIHTSADGLTCPGCEQPKARCTCRAPEPEVPAGDGIVRVSRETKGRKGKGVTLVSGVPLAGPGLAALAKRLKARCSAGGTVRDGVIELQGDHRDAVVAELAAQGYTVKRVGG